MNTEETVRSRFDARFDDPGMVLAHEVALKTPDPHPESKKIRMRRSNFKALGAATVGVVGTLIAEPYFSTRREDSQSLDMIDHLVGNATFDIALLGCVLTVYFMSEAQTIQFGHNSSTAGIHPYLFRNEQTT